MTQVESSKSDIRGANKALLAWAIIATMLLLAGAAFLGYFAHPPADTPDCRGTFSCLTASEWGDFSAGVFAPIAFLWLVVTVWIQSDELREQRVELALTRKEFEQSRSVMEEQALEARRQAEFISQQTELLMEEAKSRRQQMNLTSFTILMSRYVEHAREFSKDVYFRIGTYTGQVFKDVERGVSDEKFVFLQDEWLRAVRELKIDEIEIVRPKLFAESFIYAYGAEELIPLLPYHSRVSWDRSEIRGLLDTYCQIIAQCAQFEDLRGHVSAREKRLLGR